MLGQQLPLFVYVCMHVFIVVCRVIVYCHVNLWYRSIMRKPSHKLLNKSNHMTDNCQRVMLNMFTGHLDAKNLALLDIETLTPSIVLSTESGRRSCELRDFARPWPVWRPLCRQSIHAEAVASLSSVRRVPCCRANAEMLDELIASTGASRSLFHCYVC